MSAASEERQTPQKQPKFPKFFDKTVRSQSFSTWPETLAKKSEQLTRAGFFYDQVNECVVCFSCGISNSKEWHIRDEPWKCHALVCEGTCDYLTMVKGSDYIAFTRKKYQESKKRELLAAKERRRLKRIAGCNGERGMC